MRICFEEQDAPGRYTRQQGLENWNQARLEQARCLVVGAGALGNELLKNLALLGVGALGVVDFDRVEESNLPRCALFRPGDVGQPKALVARQRLLELVPELHCTAWCVDITTEVGAGLLEEYDLVLGAVDSIAARWQINRLARRARVGWIDAGVDGFRGQVTRFDSVDGACYECGMTDAMWQRALQRYSCGVAAEPDAERPTVAVALPIVSATAAVQAQEAVSLLMADGAAQATGLGPGERLSMALRPYELLRLYGRQRASCLVHAADRTPARPLAVSQEDTVEALLCVAGATSLLLEWEVVQGLRCGRCGFVEHIFAGWQLRREMLICAQCGGAVMPEQTSHVARGSRLAQCRLRELGVPLKAHLQLSLGEQQETRWYKIL